jgi:hypothetical protein
MMAGSQERLMVLKMLEEKRISAEEAEELLSALGRAEAERGGGERPRTERGPGPERPAFEPDLDFGELGRTIRNTVRRFTEGFGTMADKAPWGRGFGDWIRDTLGEARISVEREIRIPLELDRPPVRIAFEGSSGAISIRTTDAPSITGTAIFTVFGPDEGTARRIAEALELVSERKDDTLALSIRSSAAEDPTRQEPRRAVRREERIDLAVPRSAGLRITTTSADVTLRSLRSDTAVRTSSGRISLRLSPEARVRVEATTTSGEITVRAPLTVERFTRTHFTGLLNDAEVTVRIESASGDIRIEAEAP